MTVSSAYLFGDRITAGEVPPEPVSLFENGVWNTDILSEYWRLGSMSAPVAPGVFTTVRTQVMSDAKSYYNNSTNLYALGRNYQNLYTVSQSILTRTCTTGSSTDQSGCSIFIPFHTGSTSPMFEKEFEKISVEFRLTNPASFSYLSIGACKIVGDAYQSIRMNGSDVSGDWVTLELSLPEKQIIDALEIQTTYGKFEIRKIVLE